MSSSLTKVKPVRQVPTYHPPFYIDSEGDKFFFIDAKRPRYVIAPLVSTEDNIPDLEKLNNTVMVNARLFDLISKMIDLVKVPDGQKVISSQQDLEKLINKLFEQTKPFQEGYQNKEADSKKEEKTANSKQPKMGGFFRTVEKKSVEQPAHEYFATLYALLYTAALLGIPAEKAIHKKSSQYNRAYQKNELEEIIEFVLTGDHPVIPLKENGFFRISAQSPSTVVSAIHNKILFAKKIKEALVILTDFARISGGPSDPQKRPTVFDPEFIRKLITTTLTYQTFDKDSQRPNSFILQQGNNAFMTDAIGRYCNEAFGWDSTMTAKFVDKLGKTFQVIAPAIPASKRGKVEIPKKKMTMSAVEFTKDSLKVMNISLKRRGDEAESQGDDQYIELGFPISKGILTYWYQMVFSILANLSARLTGINQELRETILRKMASHLGKPIVEVNADAQNRVEILKKSYQQASQEGAWMLIIGKHPDSELFSVLGELLDSKLADKAYRPRLFVSVGEKRSEAATRDEARFYDCFLHEGIAPETLLSLIGYLVKGQSPSVEFEDKIYKPMPNRVPVYFKLSQLENAELLFKTLVTLHIDIVTKVRDYIFSLRKKKSENNVKEQQEEIPREFNSWILLIEFLNKLESCYYQKEGNIYYTSINPQSITSDMEDILALVNNPARKEQTIEMIKRIFRETYLYLLGNNNDLIKEIALFAKEKGFFGISQNKSALNPLASLKVKYKKRNITEEMRQNYVNLVTIHKPTEEENQNETVLGRMIKQAQDELNALQVSYNLLEMEMNSHEDIYNQGDREIYRDIRGKIEFKIKSLLSEMITQRNLLLRLAAEEKFEDLLARGSRYLNREEQFENPFREKSCLEQLILESEEKISQLKTTPILFGMDREQEGTKEYVRKLSKLWSDLKNFKK